MVSLRFGDDLVVGPFYAAGLGRRQKEQRFLGLHVRDDNMGDTSAMSPRVVDLLAQSAHVLRKSLNGLA